MSTTQIEHRSAEPGPEGPRPQQVEVGRNAGLAALIGVAAAGIGIAYLSRAVESGAALDWALAVAMCLIGATFLRTCVDARTPLLVADDQGVRIRLGRTWRGMPWRELEQVEVRTRAARWGDGRIVVHPAGLDALLDDLDPRGRRQAALAQRFTGAPLGVPLGLTTRVSVPSGDLVEALRGLAGRHADVVVDAAAAESVDDGPEIATDAVDAVDAEDAEDAEETARITTVQPVQTVQPAPTADRLVSADEVGDLWAEVQAATKESTPESETPDETASENDDHPSPVLRDPRPGLAHAISRVAERLTLRRPTQDEQDEQSEQLERPGAESQTVVASATPDPTRPLRRASRAETVHERVAEQQIAPPPADTVAEPDDLATEVVVLGDLDPAPDPVIGPQVAAARQRLRLSVDTLAERTRIRPHVIESIEVDDFGPCGGDFYARGHLRTLCRVLGIDVTPLLAEYDERYASGPIDPRRVFAAEFAGGPDGPLRQTSGAPRWSLLVGVAMALVVIWSIARLASDDPDLDRSPAVLTGVQGERAPQDQSARTGADPSTDDAKAADHTGPTPLRLTASADSDVQVVDGGGKTLWEGSLAAGEFKQLPLRQAVDVTASDGGAVTATFGGADRGTLGDPGVEATVHFTPPTR